MSSRFLRRQLMRPSASSTITSQKSRAHNLIVNYLSTNRSRSIYQYSSMAPRLSDKLLYLLLFYSYPSFLRKLRDKRNLKICHLDPKASELRSNIDISQVGIVFCSGIQGVSTHVPASHPNLLEKDSFCRRKELRIFWVHKTWSLFHSVICHTNDIK